MWTETGKNSRSASRSRNGRYTSRTCCSNTWSKFPTGWWKWAPKANRSGSS